MRKGRVVDQVAGAVGQDMRYETQNTHGAVAFLLSVTLLLQSVSFDD